MVYSSPSGQMQRYYVKSGHYSFLVYPFHLSIHWFYHLMLYKPWINSIIVTFLHCWYKCQFCRLKFSPGGSPLDWFISSDMFYLEVMLESTGGVKDVRIHHEGKVEQQVSMFSIRFEVITVLSITIGVFWNVDRWALMFHRNSVHTIRPTNARMENVFYHMLFITDMFWLLSPSSSRQFTRLQGVQTNCWKHRWTTQCYKACLKLPT